MTRKGKPGMGSTLLWDLIIAAIATASFVWLYDFAKASFFPRVSGAAADMARPAIHTGVWATVTTKLGMRRFSERVRQWQQEFKGSGGRE